jgi:hypothetical protein
MSWTKSVGYDSQQWRLFCCRAHVLAGWPPSRNSELNFLSLSLILPPTISRPVCLGIKHPSGAYDQILITVRHLRVCWSGAFSLTRGRICRLQLVLDLASAVILGSESLGTRDPRLFTVSDSRLPFLSPPTTRRVTASTWTAQKTHRLQQFFYCCRFIRSPEIPRLVDDVRACSVCHCLAMDDVSC